MIARVISHYRVLSLLGSGGMGAVYLAEDTALRRKVAIKFLLPEATLDQRAKGRLIKEARAAANLDHPNICSIYEVGQEGPDAFIVMQYVEGCTLDVCMRGGPLGLREALPIAAQVVDALAEAHGRGVTHGDVKPQNIMITPRGRAKLMDFGLAKVRAGAPQVDTLAITASLPGGPEKIVGTLPYMSPEQARGEALDARSDIFSFGAVLYEMLSGQMLFAAGSVGAIISAVLTRPAPPLSNYAAGVPPELERILEKALAKDKEERYQSAKDLLADLRRLNRRLEIEDELGQSSEPQVGNGVTSRQRALPRASGATHAGGDGTTAAPSSTGMSEGQTLAGSVTARASRLKRPLAAAVLIALALASVAAFRYLKEPPPLTQRATVLLADFENTTGDAVFDGALERALALQLGQSPFLHVFPEDRIRETLRYMERPPDERVTREVAREICHRQGLEAMIVGSISTLGSHYVIGLEAVNAQTGEVIARQQVEVEGKEQVLRALGRAASSVREELGESLPSVQKYNAPIEQATTSSLEALKAYTLGHEQHSRGNDFDAVPLLKRAVELDPDFALAYAELSLAYRNTQQYGPAAEYAKKAFALAHRVSEREKFEISARYYEYATGEMDKLTEVAGLWEQTYPSDAIPHNLLALSHLAAGRYERVLDETGEAIRLDPKFYGAHANRATANVRLGRLGEAERVIGQAFAQGLDGIFFHYHLYVIAFVRGDSEGMGRQIQWASNSQDAAQAFGWQAEAAAFSGRMRQAQELYRQGIEIARPRRPETAARLAANKALRNAAVGDCRRVRANAEEAVALTRGNFSMTRGALALALCGEVARAESLADQLSDDNPNDTVLNAVWLPVIRAAVELRKGNAAGALKLLQGVVPYEAAALFWPNYIRALASLRQKAWPEAEAEFRKMLEHRGWDPTSPLYPLAYLGLARAAAQRGDSVTSGKAYQEFFALWKDADPDIPIFQEAKKEYRPALNNRDAG